MIEAMARAHCDYFGGAGHYDSGLAADNKPTMNAAMLDAVAAMIDNLPDGAVRAGRDAYNGGLEEMADAQNSRGYTIKYLPHKAFRAAIIAALQHVMGADHG